MPLTDTEIRRAQPQAKSYRLADSGGLSLEVSPAGGKLFRWKYRFERKEKLMALGKYPQVSLAVARKRHASGRELLAAGIDPSAQRKSEKTVQKDIVEKSFATIAGKWLEHWKDDKSPRHVDSTGRRLATNILPSLGSLQMADIRAPHIVAMAQTIEARGARDVAKRALETTNQIFRFAIAHGLTDRNPAAEIRPRDILKPSPKTNYSRIDEKDLPELLRKIEFYQGTHVTRVALKLMSLTFVRTGELIGAKWSEFDLEVGRWTIPAERMKMRSLHIVPLARQTRELLGMLCELTGHSEYLFPGDRTPLKPMSNMTILKALDRMGYKGRMTGHGFRGLASTMLHEREYPQEHIELQLAHARRNTVAAAYNHAQHLTARTKMMQEWADILEQAQRGAKVLPFREDAA